MSKHAPDITDTSRRNFTKAIVAAAVATPIAASLVGCQKKSTNSNLAAPSPVPGGPSIVACDSATTGIEEHIPPMELDGSGSLRLELSNMLRTTSGAAPFRYVEDGIRRANDRYGELESVLVISELYPKVDDQYISVKNYSGLPPGSQLLLWYQKIFPPNPPGGDDTDVGYENVATYPPRDPDVRIIGGPGNGRYFEMTLKHKELAPRDFSHKPGRPWRYTHRPDATIAGLGRHFRIGQWRIVGPDGETVVAPNFEGRDAVDYKLYPTFDDFHGS